MSNKNQMSMFGRTPSKNDEKEFVDKIMEVINSVRRPKIVLPGYEDMTMPSDMENAIMMERFVLAKKDEKIATETEALWYLSNASLAAPLSPSWYRIYMFLFQKWAERNKKQIPDDLKGNVVLEKQEERDLQNLRDWLYKKSMDALK